MKTISDLFLALSTLDEIKPSCIFIRKLYSAFDNFFEFFTSEYNYSKLNISCHEIEKIKIVKKALENVNLEKTKKLLDDRKIKFLALSDIKYPEKLKAINDPPFGLFYKGNLDLLKHKLAISIVGTRSATKYGLSVARKISILLAKQNIVVISGLANGIDTSAHEGAVSSGKTIAILGTGPDVIFPASNRKLYEEILEKEGLILSEYMPGIEGMPWNFPQRNRIISALSDAVVVIEGDLQSGALITARFAIKQDKPLFALPGPVDSLQSNGPNILIKSGVAELLTSVNDILEKIGEAKQVQLDFKDGNKSPSELSEVQKNIYNILSSKTLSFDELVQCTNLETKNLLTNLSILELKGFIEKAPEGGYVKV